MVISVYRNPSFLLATVCCDLGERGSFPSAFDSPLLGVISVHWKWGGRGCTYLVDSTCISSLCIFFMCRTILLFRLYWRSQNGQELVFSREWHDMCFVRLLWDRNLNVNNTISAIRFHTTFHGTDEGSILRMCFLMVLKSWRRFKYTSTGFIWTDIGILIGVLQFMSFTVTMHKRYQTSER